MLCYHVAAFSDVKCDDPDEEKVQQEEPKGERISLTDLLVSTVRLPGDSVSMFDAGFILNVAVASDVKCDDSEEEVTRLLEGDSKEEELEEGEEGEIYFCFICYPESFKFLVYSAIRNLLFGIVPE